MRAALLAAAALALLPGCATMRAIDAPAAQSALARADASFDRLRVIADPLIDRLPAARQARARSILTTIGTVLDLARTAAGVAAQRDAIARADALLAALADALDQ